MSKTVDINHVQIVAQVASALSQRVISSDVVAGTTKYYYDSEEALAKKAVKLAMSIVKEIQHQAELAEAEQRLARE